MGRVSNSIRNAAAGMILQGITAILSLVTRSAMIYILGIEAVAINGLFTQVISALSMAELGIGGAIIFSLYKPLAEKDYQKINQLVTLFKQAYTVIAAATIIIGAALCPWIQYLVNGLDYEVSYLRLVYMLFVCQCASSYLFAHKGALLNADQQYREVAKVTAVIKVLGTLLQIGIIFITRHYIGYLLTSIGINIATNLFVSIKTDQLYPFLKTDNGLDRKEKKEVFSNVKNIFFKQLAGKVVDSTDNILISTLVNTLLVGYYANYVAIMEILKQFAFQLASGITASLGNLFVSEDKGRCEEVFLRLVFLFNAMALIMTACTFGCVQTFISLWIGNQYLLPEITVFWCCINMYSNVAISPLSTSMHLIGHFDIGRNISICSAVVNLIVSIILGKIYGMPGIFIGTFCTYVIEFFAKTHYVYKLFFEKSLMKTLVRGLMSFGSLLVLLVIEHFLVQRIMIESLIVKFVVIGFMCAFLSMIAIVITWFNTDALRYWITFGKRFLKK